MVSTLTTLYPDQPALWSPDRAYRSFLRRPATVDMREAGWPPIAFILLNPSTADEKRDDPTVAKARRYAQAWGYGEVIILNAVAFRATDPRIMRVHSDPVGPLNDEVIGNTVQAVQQAGGTIVCGWGNHGKLRGRDVAMRERLSGLSLRAFPLTKQGEPGHPLYLRRDVQTVPFHP